MVEQGSGAADGRPAEPAPAFIEVDGPVRVEGAGGGPLAGLTFGAKDLFEVAGHRTGAGNPDWLRTHPPAARTAPVVAALVAAGASLVGKTQTDELAYSILGQNHWYGTPRNPAAPDRLPGGSSSGSASATAAGDVDFAIGTDTAGSIRVPASWCGLFGIRPTHGATDLTGVVPLAPAFDTVGWFARSAELLHRVGRVLLQRPAEPEPAPITRLLRVGDQWAVAADVVRDAADAWLRGAWPDGVDDRSTWVRVGEGGGSAGSDDRARGAVEWIGTVVDFEPADPGPAEVFRVLQGAEVRTCHQAWIDEVHPAFGPGVSDRFAALAGITTAQVRDAGAWRAGFTDRLVELLTPGTALVMPTTPVPAPRRDAGRAELAAARPRILALTTVASLAGLPQVSVPALEVEGAPVGMSFVGAPGSDHALLELARLVGGRR